MVINFTKIFKDLATKFQIKSSTIYLHEGAEFDVFSHNSEIDRSCTYVSLINANDNFRF